VIPEQARQAWQYQRQRLLRAPRRLLAHCSRAKRVIPGQARRAAQNKPYQRLLRAPRRLLVSYQCHRAKRVIPEQAGRTVQNLFGSRAGVRASKKPNFRFLKFLCVYSNLVSEHIESGNMLAIKEACIQ
jgi:hypothetical protein